MKGFLGLVSLAVVVQGVLAHTIFQELYVNGISAGHTQGIRVPTYDGVCHQRIYVFLKHQLVY